jgi:hypothetical protein
VAGVGYQHAEYGEREHGQHGVAMPSGPAADLVVVEPDLAFPGLEALLDRPSGAGDADQAPERDRGGGPAQVVRELAGAAVAADQQPPVSVVAGLVRVDPDQAQS